MPRGGARPGAGRKPGSASAKTREIANKAAETGVTPLEVSLALMRHYWAKATDANGKIIDEAYAEKADAAGERAKPFVHPRLASIEHSGPDGGPIEHRMRHAKGDLASKLARLKPPSTGEVPQKPQ